MRIIRKGRREEGWRKGGKEERKDTREEAWGELGKEEGRRE